ncbi:hypothetical protein AB1287_22235 [Enterobacter asburiae]|uniref:hypothetical protein n=1 Tax=Scandinavium sp. UTDF21-P1B TaxID=3446379 RepID=UPI00346B53F5
MSLYRYGGEDSGGFGEWHTEPLEQLVASVHGALYQAKQKGKNQIVRAGSK